MLFFASLGYTVVGIDVSQKGIAETKRRLAAHSLSATMHHRSFAECLPCEDESVEAVIAVQSIHHSRIEGIHALAREIARVVRPKGLFFVTVPATRSAASAWREVEPDTFEPVDGLEQGVPHYYFTSESLLSTFSGFSVISSGIDDFCHHYLLAEKD